MAIVEVDELTEAKEDLKQLIEVLLLELKHYLIGIIKEFNHLLD